MLFSRLFHRKRIHQKGSNKEVGEMFPIIVSPNSDLKKSDNQLTKSKPKTTPSPEKMSPDKSPTSKKREMFDYKSEAVRKVEEIARNRDERRQKQAEERAAKDMNVVLEQNHPHYEFAQMIAEVRAKMHFQPIKDDDEAIENQIVVCIRKRPLNGKEAAKGEIDVLSVPTKTQLVVHEAKTKVDLTKYLENQTFRFDYVFSEACLNETVYKFTAKPLVRTVLQGGMATCFAYGQTGSGKTHTMGGEFRGKHQNFYNGIYALVARDIFEYLGRGTHDYQVTATFFEIYGKLTFDLLGKRKRLRVLEDGHQVVQVVGLTERPVGRIGDIMDLIKEGSLGRTFGQTSANSISSRSHAVFQIILRKRNVAQIYGKMSLIDLAGNERGADTNESSRKTRMEGADINRSLLALKECIRALGKKGKHCPFRESILTKILRDSFIGEKSRTCMIAMVSPNIGSTEHSLNTLRYADRVKELVANDFNEEGEEESDETSPRSEKDATTLEWELLDSASNVIENCANFQVKGKKLFDETKKDGYNRQEFVENWRELLRSMIEVQRDAYLKATEFCNYLQE